MYQKKRYTPFSFYTHSAGFVPLAESNRHKYPVKTRAYAIQQRLGGKMGKHPTSRHNF